MGETNAEYLRYHECLVGNRPDMMPLDVHLFNDWHVPAHDNIIPSFVRRTFGYSPAYCPSSRDWAAGATRCVYLQSLAAIEPKCLPWWTASLFSKSEGMREPSPLAMVPLPQGDPPWTSELSNIDGSV